jgi:nicotinate phosphoribosyltransferase
MIQVVRSHHDAVEYRFKCRNEGVDLTPYVDEIRDEVKALCSVRFRKDELDYLRGWRFMKSDFVDLLGLFHMDERFISIEPIPGPGGEIDITIRGPWLHTICSVLSRDRQ